MQDVGLSPGQLLYGRNLRDSLLLREQGLSVCPDWKLLAEDRERALVKRNLPANERYDYT